MAFETGSSVPVWAVTTAEGSVSVDPRVLEDTSGRVVVGGGLEDAVEGSTVTIQWRSPGVAYASGAGAPPSRGRACRYTDASVTLSAEAAPCGLTDGDLAAVTSAPHLCPSPSDDGGTTAPAPPCPPVAWAVIELGEPVPAELVVVRGCSGGCAVEVSSDGASYRPAGGGSEGFGAVLLDGSAITSVRVGVTSSASVREVSVWGPRPPDPPLRTLDQSASDKLRGPFGTGSGDDGIPVWLLIAAGILAACVLVAIGFMVGRLRSQSRPSTPFSTH